jgi:carbonic anhydrase
MTLATRRSLLAATGFVVAAGLGGVAVVNRGGRGPAAARPASTTAAAALAELRAGNARYVASHRTDSAVTDHDADERRELAKGQHPIAAVLCCSDSRLCPEYIFDQRPGRLFDVRNVGNVVDDDVMASLEYAVEHLHVRLVVVLGHTGCGAIEAVRAAGEAPLPDHLRAVQDHMAGIRPQLRAARYQPAAGVSDLLARENAKAQAATLLQDSAPVRTLVRRGAFRLLYGLYDLETGAVEFFDR